MNALETLVNGKFLGFGPVGISIDRLVRSFPSVYQLLPTYDCLDVGNGRLRDLTDSDLPNIDNGNINDALAFHSQITGSIETNPQIRNFRDEGHRSTHKPIGSASQWPDRTAAES